jgi:hypothetical protein
MNGIIIIEPASEEGTATAGKTMKVDITSAGDHYVILSDEALNVGDSIMYKGKSYKIKSSEKLKLKRHKSIAAI